MARPTTGGGRPASRLCIRFCPNHFFFTFARLPDAVSSYAQTNETRLPYYEIKSPPPNHSAPVLQEPVTPIPKGASIQGSMAPSIPHTVAGPTTKSVWDVTEEEQAIPQTPSIPKAVPIQASASSGHLPMPKSSPATSRSM